MNSLEQQDICIYSRKRIELTGIEEVESFTENSIVMRSTLGSVSVEGEGLKIDRFSTEKGELIITGKFDCVYYFDNDRSDKKGFFARFIR